VSAFFCFVLSCVGTGRVGWVRCHHGMVRPQVADGGKSSGYGG
jgi:hypothetical protein